MITYKEVQSRLQGRYDHWFKSLCSYIDQEIVNEWDKRRQQVSLGGIPVPVPYADPIHISSLSSEMRNRLLAHYRTEWDVVVEVRGFWHKTTYWTFKEKA